MALADDIRRLARIPLLAQMDQDALRLIAFSAEARILRKGDTLFKKGEASDGGFIVVTGSMMLDIDEGRTPPRVVGPDSLIGEIALIAPSTRPATATAREATAVLRISRTLFHRVLDEHPEYAVRIRDVIARRLEEFVDELGTTDAWSLDAVSKG